jgi:hypothetical protein
LAGITVGSNLPLRAASGYHRINDGFVVLDFLQFLNAVLLTDDNSVPMANDFELRFVHASPTASGVDVDITAPKRADLRSAGPSFAKVAFGGFAGYANQPQGTFQLRVTSTGTKNVISDTGALTCMAGQIGRAVLINPPGSATEPLGIVLQRDMQ